MEKGLEVLHWRGDVNQSDERGVEVVTNGYNLLDRTPYGRQEDFEGLASGPAPQAHLWTGAPSQPRSTTKGGIHTPFGRKLPGDLVRYLVEPWIVRNEALAKR